MILVILSMEKKCKMHLIIIVNTMKCTSNINKILSVFNAGNAKKHEKNNIDRLERKRYFFKKR